jgi:pimeloyl-ACP methyl ester carboxylesterase
LVIYWKRINKHIDFLSTNIKTLNKKENPTLHKSVSNKILNLKKFLSDTIHERFDETADPALVAWFIEQAGSNDPAFIVRFVLHMCTHDFMEELVGIKCPTLIVAAGKESIGHADAYEQMHQRIKGSEVAYVDTAGHNICDGYAEHCAQLLMSFLSRHV